jgi:hypothetical protein
MFNHYGKKQIFEHEFSILWRFQLVIFGFRVAMAPEKRPVHVSTPRPPAPW